MNGPADRDWGLVCFAVGVSVIVAWLAAFMVAMQVGAAWLAIDLAYAFLAACGAWLVGAVWWMVLGA